MLKPDQLNFQICACLKQRRSFAVAVASCLHEAILAQKHSMKEYVGTNGRRLPCGRVVGLRDAPTR